MSTRCQNDQWARHELQTLVEMFGDPTVRKLFLKEWLLRETATPVVNQSRRRVCGLDEAFFGSHEGHRSVQYDRHAHRQEHHGQVTSDTEAEPRALYAYPGRRARSSGRS